MNIDSPETKAFMLELYTLTGGNTEVQVSMYEVGKALGLDRAAIEVMSEELIIEELVELKTLAGGIGITGKSMEMLGLSEHAGETSSLPPPLGAGPVLNGQDQQQIDDILKEIKRAAFCGQAGYAQLEELIIDLKTLETQLLSPRPKTAIIRAILDSMQEGLRLSDCRVLAARIEKLLGAK